MIGILQQTGAARQS
jgi:hypothetical protein